MREHFRNKALKNEYDTIVLGVVPDGSRDTNGRRQMMSAVEFVKPVPVSTHPSRVDM